MEDGRRGNGLHGVESQSRLNVSPPAQSCIFFGVTFVSCVTMESHLTPLSLSMLICKIGKQFLPLRAVARLN